MKKLSRKEVIKILETKSDTTTYNAIANLTGYHPKSLIRINRLLKNNQYNIREEKNKNLENEIINAYLNSNYKTYKAFYNNTIDKYHISYQKLCKILKTSKINKELVIIKKVKIKSNYYFEIIDYKNEIKLFSMDSLKNDIKSIKLILYKLIENYGAPKYITFHSFYKKVPIEILNILEKYNINIISFKGIYRNIFKNLSNENKNIKYQKINIVKEDFYQFSIRKTIADNIVQFNNVRYKINTNKVIKKNIEVIIYFNNEKDDLFIKYNNKNYKLTIIKRVTSKKGTSKYI